MKRLALILILCPFMLYSHIGRDFIPTNEDINANLFSLYNMEYRSLILNYNHYNGNSGDMDMTMVFPSEWNGTTGANLYIYDFPSAQIFRNTTVNTNYSYGFNFNYSNILFNSGIGVAFNVNFIGKFQNIYLSPGIAYFISNQYGNYSYIFITPSYELIDREINISSGFYGLYNKRLAVQGIAGVPTDLNANNLMLNLASQYKLPLNFVIGGDLRYENRIFFSSVKTGFSFEYFMLFAGVKYKDLLVDNFFIELVLISRFGGIVKF